MTTKSVLGLMPSNKDEINNFAADLVAKVESGDVNALELKAQLKFIEATIKKIDAKIKEAVMQEADKHPKQFNLLGWRIEKVETGVKYDYSNDALHENLSRQLKDREAFLKGLPKPMADPETGEIVAPPIRRSTSSLKFTL